MRYYELLYIVNSNFERKRIDETMKEIDNRIKETKSKIVNHIVWGKKKLAYPVNCNKYGTYVLVHYQSGDNKKLKEFDSWLKLSDLVIRHMIVRLDSEPDKIKKVDIDISQKETNDVENEEKVVSKETNDVENEEKVVSKGKNDVENEEKVVSKGKNDVENEGEE